MNRGNDFEIPEMDNGDAIGKWDLARAQLDGVPLVFWYYVDMDTMAKLGIERPCKLEVDVRDTHAVDASRQKFVIKGFVDFPKIGVRPVTIHLGEYKRNDGQMSARMVGTFND